ERMRMTRGAISKIVKKLIGKELVESYQVLENKKEIYFRLTENGRRLFDEHLKCHTQARCEKLALLQEFTAAEQDCILRFLSAINVQIDAKVADACAPCAMGCPASRAEGDQ
ncbi:MAG: MarR family transcriptional regulator, partial [Deltaproteobacteria bacterium]|nr:MarR family transcriptional regulator [Deltaproteobacteria bacterium]